MVTFLKGSKVQPKCGFSATVVGILRRLEVEESMGWESMDILEFPELRTAMKVYSNWPTFPQVYIDGEFYGGCDILTVHVDGRASNHHLINAAALGQLKPNCLFVNAARGLLVDYAALGGWLREHPQAEAIIDVHDPEPPAADYPLYGLENVTLLPHLAARTETALRNMSWVVEDIWRILNSEKPKYPAAELH